MELSIRKTKARCTEAAAAVARGERVVITKHGHALVALVPVRGAAVFDEDRAAAVRRDLGLDGLTVRLPAGFDASASSRAVLGLPD